MRLALLISAVATFFSCSSPLGVAQDKWADLQLTFVYDGDKIPASKKLDMGKDAWCAALPETHDEALIINPTNKGIKNFGFWLEAAKSGIKPDDVHPDLKDPPADSPILDNKQCVFVPRFFVMRSGQTLVVKNSDETGHNANFSFFENEAKNPSVPAGGQIELLVAKPEMAVMKVECTTHGWMQANFLVLDHSYAGVSDENGVLKIAKLPAGRKLTFRVFHENQAKGQETFMLDGKKVEWKKGYAELELKPGENSMVVKVPVEKFKNK